MNKQRKKNDLATTDRREIADETRRDNRSKNDELTIERREKADKIREEHRLRNDEITNNRRKMNDRNPWKTLVVSLLILAVLSIAAYVFFFIK